MSGVGINQAVIARRLFDGDAWLDDHALIIEGDKISALIPRQEVPANLETLDLGELSLAPGLVDIQVNGGGGVMLNNEPSAEGVRQIANAHRQYGTTGVMPTLISDTPQIQREAAAAVNEVRSQGTAGVLGLHLEGPHFSLERRGTHKASMIRPPATDDIDWMSELQDFPVIVTLAPEQAEAGTVRRLSDAGTPTTCRSARQSSRWRWPPPPQFGSNRRRFGSRRRPRPPTARRGRAPHRFRWARAWAQSASGSRSSATELMQ